jgi:hypothetical protein
VLGIAMDILDYARRVLETAKYSTLAEDKNLLIFEDHSLFGFVWVASSPSEILRKWQQRQDDFLRGRDVQLRNAREKSWNAYSVFLTEPEGTPSEMNEILAIEDDFRGTRKIVKTGIETESHVTQALFPFIAIQSLVQLAEDDAIARLRTRLASLHIDVLNAFLGESDPAEIVGILLRKNYEDK